MAGFWGTCEYFKTDPFELKEKTMIGIRYIIQKTEKFHFPV